MVAVCGGAAWAETSPYYIGVSQNVRRDSNITKTIEGSELSDTISSTGLTAGLDQPLGRQRLRVSLDTRLNRYSSHSEYNNTDYNAKAGLAWETVERLSGDLSVGSRQALYQDSSRTQTIGKNTLRTDNAAFTARLGANTLWMFDAGVSAQRDRFSNSLYSASNLRQHTFSTGVTYQPSPDWWVRVGGRRTSGSYYDQTDEISRNDFEISTLLKVSGASTLNARIGRTHESHTTSTRRDINSYTGSLGWDWVASGKSSLGITLSRDSAVGGRFDTALPVWITGNADSVLTNVLSVRGLWQATSKIRLNANLAYARRTLDGGVVLDQIHDSTRSATLGLTYAALRNLEFGCNLTNERRRSDNQISISYPYKGRTYGCYGQAMLR